MNNTKIDKSVTVSNETRLCFVNPNAVNGTINGVPLTPPYEDMCISVNYVVVNLKVIMKILLFVAEFATILSDENMEN